MKYRNPVISGFHPDPSVCRVGEDYYLATSSFEYFPGVPLFHSRDLANWRPIGHCLTRESQLPLGNCPSGVSGIFAPTLRFHAGRFYMVTTNVFTKWNFFVYADDPAGAWSEPVFIDRQGYDPSLFFDDDGRVYYSRWGDGGMIVTGEIDIATGKLLGSPNAIDSVWGPLSPVRPVWAGGGGLFPEGPHLYKINGRYYLMAAEGGTHIGHVETIARGDTPLGPFKNCPSNPILTHRSDNLLPIQATGHADIIQAHDGSWWLVFLGIRPRVRQFFPYHHLGRETFLAPVTWSDDGWPIVNGGQLVQLEMEAGCLSPHPWPTDPVRDDFDSPQPRLCWNYLRNPRRENYSLSARKGFLRLMGSEVTLDEEASPTFLGRRQQHFRCRVAAWLEFSPERQDQQAGLSVLANHAHHYDVFVTVRAGRRCVVLRQRIGELCVETARRELPDGPVVLEVLADEDHYHFACLPSGDAKLKMDLGMAQTRYLATEVVGGFTGVYLGLFAAGATSGPNRPADFDWFEYEGQNV